MTFSDEPAQAILGYAQLPTMHYKENNKSSLFSDIVWTRRCSYSDAFGEVTT
jgi:hypothetical protein